MLSILYSSHWPDFRNVSYLLGASSLIFLTLEQTIMLMYQEVGSSGEAQLKDKIGVLQSTVGTSKLGIWNKWNHFIFMEPLKKNPLTCKGQQPCKLSLWSDKNMEGKRNSVLLSTPFETICYRDSFVFSIKLCSLLGYLFQDFTIFQPSQTYNFINTITFQFMIELSW